MYNKYVSLPASTPFSELTLKLGKKLELKHYVHIQCTSTTVIITTDTCMAMYCVVGDCYFDATMYMLVVYKNVWYVGIM